MAPKKNGRTSKTAHVLSLLTNVTENPAPESEPSAPVHTLLPPVLEQTRTREDSMAQSIRLALEQELEKELCEQSSAEEIPSPEDSPEAETPDSVCAAPEAEPESVIAPEPAAESEPEAESAEALVMVNVIERLVEMASYKYMKLFGVCTCRRCRLDVQALALENLPAKYVVTNKALASSLPLFYEDAYRSAIIAQLTHACRAVMEHPHHKDGA